MMKNAIKLLMRLMKSLVKLICLSDGQNDDLTESGGSEEEGEDQVNHGGAHGRLHFFCSRTQVKHWMNQIIIFCQFKVKLRRLESSRKRTKTQQIRFFQQTKSSICLESNSGRLLFQIIQ